MGTAVAGGGRRAMFGCEEVWGHSGQCEPVHDFGAAAWVPGWLRKGVGAEAEQLYFGYLRWVFGMKAVRGQLAPR